WTWREKQILDHRVGTQEIETREKQFGIGGHALKNGVRQFEPLRLHRALARTAVSVEQRDQIANQQSPVESVRIAREREVLRVVDWPACGPHAIPKLGAQVAARQLGPGRVNAEAYRVCERRRHMAGHAKI